MLQEDASAAVSAAAPNSSRSTPALALAAPPSLAEKTALVVRRTDVIDLTSSETGEESGQVAAEQAAVPAGVPPSDGGLTASQRGYLRCLLEMGHLQNMLTLVAGWSIMAPGVATLQLQFVSLSVCLPCQSASSSFESYSLMTLAVSGSHVPYCFCPTVCLSVFRKNKVPGRIYQAAAVATFTSVTLSAWQSVHLLSPPPL